jgi:Fe-S-cluster-containing dehydrogenase component
VAAPTTAEARARRTAPEGAVGMLYDATLCIGCKACVVACRDANGLPPSRDEKTGGLHDMQTDLDGTTRNVIKLYQEGSVWSFVKSQCMHCVDPACVSVCMIGGLSKNPESGIVEYDRDRCVGCRYCQVACPFNVPKFEWQSATPCITKCEMCRHRQAQGREPACTEVCPRDAVIFGPLEELKAEAHRRLREHSGRYVPRVYGEHDMGGTQVLYLSAVPFEKLGLPDKGTESVPALAEAIQHGVYQGFITPAVLYAGLAVTVVRNWRKSRELRDEHAEQAAAPAAPAQREEDEP